MVMYFGGGTVDVCVIQTGILGMTPKIISTAGDPELGGKDFDDIIKKLFFKQNLDKIAYNDLSECERFELRDRIREAKEAASEHFLLGQDHKHSLGLTRGEFELSLVKSEFLNIVNDSGLYEKIELCINSALEHGGIHPEQITKVILTGGSSRWFFLREIVAKKFTLGGERIFCTETPFTDVATGCAISIGLASQAPKKEGIWVKYRLSDNVPYSEAKCLLVPGRNDKLLQTGTQFIGILPQTLYFHPWRIYLSWWHGFEKDQLEQIGTEAAIDVFARSNFPFLSKLKNAKEVLKGKKPEVLEDIYKIYLKYKEDAVGVCTYQFEIMDNKAALYTKKELTEGAEAIKDLSKGWCCRGEIMPGFLSYQGMLGLREHKLKKWKPPVPVQQSSSTTNPFKKKKINWPWEK